jgi:hypothetical protein
VHDSSDFERRGVPSVFVASSVFEEAADVQGEAIGFHPHRVFVEHPIQDRTDEEMQVIATNVVDQLIDQLTS